MVLKSETGNRLIAETLAIAKSVKDANFIRWEIKDDHSIIIKTIISGKELSWITYDAEQLDELIRQLQSARDMLRHQ